MSQASVSLQAIMMGLSRVLSIYALFYPNLLVPVHFLVLGEEVYLREHRCCWLALLCVEWCQLSERSLNISCKQKIMDKIKLPHEK